MEEINEFNEQRQCSTSYRNTPYFGNISTILAFRFNCTPIPCLCLCAFHYSLQISSDLLRATDKSTRKQAGRRNDPSPLRFRAEVTRGDDKCWSGWWCGQQRYCALWAKPTCHRSRNLRPACSDRDPQPRRCTPAPWSSLKTQVGEGTGIEMTGIRSRSLKSLCSCARNSAARQHSSPDNVGHFPWHAKCGKVCHIPSNPLCLETGQGCYHRVWLAAVRISVLRCPRCAHLSALAQERAELGDACGFLGGWACALGTALEEKKGWK